MHNYLPLGNQKILERFSFFNRQSLLQANSQLVKVSFQKSFISNGCATTIAFYTSVGKIHIEQTFGSFEEQLPSTQFARIHKSHMVSLSKIESIEKNRVKIGKELLPVSESYRDWFYLNIIN